MSRFIDAVISGCSDRGLLPNRGGCIIALAASLDKYLETAVSAFLYYCSLLIGIRQFSISISTTRTHPQTAKLSFLRNLTRTLGFARPTSPASMSSAKTKAQQIIDGNSVVVFSKSYCPYCRATKSLLSEKHAKFYLMELDEVGMLHTLLV